MRRLAASALLIVFFAVPVNGQSLIGSVSGTVHDEQGGTLPGVSVSLAGKTGEKTARTDERGYYRFPTLDPGRYDLRAELPGFQTVSRPGLDISIGTQLTVDLSLRVSGREETVEVMGEAPIVDVTSSSTTTSLSQQLLFNLPLSRRAQDILNYAPAINDDTAYGGSDGSNALYLDGLDTRSPSTGSQYVYVNYNIIDEVQVGGLGANAEYGGFTGAIVNTVTKSGGNQFSALLDLQWSTGDFGADNVSAETAALNPALQEPQKTTKLLDATFQLSGPIVKDKLFFLASAQRYELNEKPRGPRTSLEEVTPRLNLKLTYQPSSNDNLSLAFQGEDYNRTGLSNARFIGAAGTTDETSRREDSQDRLINFQWRHLFGNRTFSELKYVGWWAYDYLDPEVEEPLRFEFADGSYSGGGGYRSYFNRRRHQLNASVSHYAEAFGRHDFKFGVELERSRVRDRLSYVGGFYYYDYYGAPYLAYSYGYDQTGDNQRESLYAQDSWRVSDRLTINAGLRLDNVRGRSPELDEKVFETRSLAPRIGFAWDATGDRKTVLRGFYGRYYEGVFQTYYFRVLPGLEDFVTYDNSSGVPVEIDRTPLSEIIYRVDPDIEHPRIDEWSVALERALTQDVRLVATGIFRENKNFIGSVNHSARWERLTVENPLTGQPLPVYGWANPDESERDFLITNPDGFVFLDTDGQPIGTAEASRRYKALMLVLQKRLANRWQAQVSYVLSKSDGTVDPFSVVNVGYGRQFENPNLALTNADGEHTGSRRHEFKVFATYEIPKIDVNANAYYRFISGYPYTAFTRFSASEIPGLPGAGREPWLEPLGSNRGEDESLLDLRFEKVFRLGAGRDRLAVYADIFNVFNSEWINDVVIRYPSSSIDGVDVPFGGPASLGTPRQLTLGARWSF